jgi:hypothetical protein
MSDAAGRVCGEPGTRLGRLRRMVSRAKGDSAQHQVRFREGYSRGRQSASAAGAGHGPDVTGVFCDDWLSHEARFRL